MSATTIAGWTVSWDSTPKEPQFPVRCLEEELLPLVEIKVEKTPLKDSPAATNRREYRRKWMLKDRARARAEAKAYAMADGRHE